MASSASLSLACVAASWTAGADGGGGLRAAGDGGLGQGGVAELDVDQGGVDAEGVGGGLGHDGVDAGAEVLRAGADEDAAVGKDADDGLRGGAVGGVGGGGHAVADELVAFDHLAGLGGCVWTSRSARRPAV